MLARAPDRPFSLDPLIQEAKRRARQRRALVGVGIVLVAGAAAGAMLATRPPSGPAAAGRSAARPTPNRLALVEAKGAPFPIRTYVLTLRHKRWLTLSEVKVTENGRSVLDPILSPAVEASGGGISSKEYLLQYKSLPETDKTIRVQVKVEGTGTAVARYASPALLRP